MPPPPPLSYTPVPTDCPALSSYSKTNRLHLDTAVCLSVSLAPPLPPLSASAPHSAELRSPLLTLSQLPPNFSPHFTLACSFSCSCFLRQRCAECIMQSTGLWGRWAAEFITPTSSSCILILMQTQRRIDLLCTKMKIYSSLCANKPGPCEVQPLLHNNHIQAEEQI